MKSYSVKEISELLGTSPETVRRWIRAGKLSATQESRKEGNSVPETELQRFLKSTPKYASIAATSALVSLPTIGVPLVACGLIGATVLDKVDTARKLNDSRINTDAIIDYLNKTIDTHQRLIKKDRQAIQRLREEIESEENQISSLKKLIDEFQSCQKED